MRAASALEAANLESGFAGLDVGQPHLLLARRALRVSHGYAFIVSLITVRISSHWLPIVQCAAA
jgi:hypothetical protein